jgi:hypothetical protein
MASEKRLIDAKVLEAKIEKDFRKLIANQSRADLAAALSYVGDMVIDAPTVDAVEVVHGRWINRTKVVHNMVDERNDCSNCGQVYWFAVPDFNYCPNCGAKMDGDGNADV